MSVATAPGSRWLDSVGAARRVRGVWLAIGLTGAVVATWSAAASPVLTAPVATGILRGSAIAAYTVVGVITQKRRPTEPLASILVVLALGYVFTSPVVSSNPTANAAGRVVLAAWLGLWFYAFLGFPSGHLDRAGRLILRAYVAAAVLLWPWAALIATKLPAPGPLATCGSSCPANGLQVWNVPSPLAKLPVDLITAVTTVVALATVTVLARRARSSVGVERRIAAPVLGAATVTIVAYAVTTLHPEGSDTWETVSLFIAGAAALLVPIAFILAPLRGELFVSRSFWRGLSGFDYAGFSPADVEDLCRRALGDDSLRLAVVGTGPDDLLDLSGKPVVPPGSAAVTFVEGRYGHYAVLHDASLVRGYTVLVERVGALAVTLLEYVRVLRDTIVSRRRVAESESEQRLRLEKELHDGAQQYLVALHIKLNLLQEEMAGSEWEPRVGDLSQDAYRAYEELTRIARGIYPTSLAQHGLAAAFREIPMPPSIAFSVSDSGVGRLPRSHEWAVYLAVLEAIQNATKHSDASTVSVTFGRSGDTAQVTVRDDGCGFDAATGGTGLTDIRDRIESIGGRVTITSWLGGGTLVELSVPGRE